MDIPWRISSVPKVRAVLIHEKVDVPASFALSLGGKLENLPDDIRTQISYDRKVARNLATGKCSGSPRTWSLWPWMPPATFRLHPGSRPAGHPRRDGAGEAPAGSEDLDRDR